MHNDLKFTNAADVVEYAPTVTISPRVLGVRYVEIDGITVADIYDHGDDGAEIVSDDYEWQAACGHDRCKENRKYFNNIDEALDFARALAERIQLFSEL